MYSLTILLYNRHKFCVSDADLLRWVCVVYIPYTLSILRECCCIVCMDIHLGSHICFRLIQLMEEIMAEKENKTIIFVETKRRCDDLTRRMRRDG